MKCIYCKKEIEGIQHICPHCNMPNFIDKETMALEEVKKEKYENDNFSITPDQERISKVGKWLCIFFYAVIILILSVSFIIIHSGTDGNYSRKWGPIFSYYLPLAYFAIAGSPLKYKRTIFHFLLYIGLLLGYLLLGIIFIEPFGFVNFRASNVVGADVNAYSSAQYFIYNLECIIIFTLYFITHVFNLKDYINQHQKMNYNVILAFTATVCVSLLLSKITLHISFMQQFSFWLINTYFG